MSGFDEMGDGLYEEGRRLLEDPPEENEWKVYQKVKGFNAFPEQYKNIFYSL